MGLSYDIPTEFDEGSTASDVVVTWTDDDDKEYGPITTTHDVWVTNGEEGAPTGGIDTHDDDMTVFAVETVAAFAEDDIGVASVAFLVDGSVAETATTEPYLFEWDTTQEDAGAHELQVRVTDGESTVATSAPIRLHVDNDLTSLDRVRVDANRLGVDAAAMMSVTAILDPTQLSSRYLSATEITGDSSGEMLQALVEWDELESETQDAIIELSEDRVTAAYAFVPPAPIDVADFEHCTSHAVCTLATDHFSIRYYLDNAAHAVARQDQLQADLTDTNCTSVTPEDGECNHVPDYVDKLAAGLEHSWAVYSNLGRSATIRRSRLRTWSRS